MKKLIQILLGALIHLLMTSFALAQLGTGGIYGKVLEGSSREPIPFANISVIQQEKVITGSTSDFDGNYRIRGLQPGQYSVKVSVVGYAAVQKTGVLVKANQRIEVNFELAVGIKLEEVQVVAYVVPLITQDASAKTTISGRSIEKMPARGCAAVITTVAGVQNHRGRIGTINGTRSGSTDTYIDGVKVRGSSALLGQDLREESLGDVLTNHAPASGKSSAETLKRKKKKLLPKGLVAGYDLYRQQAFKSVFSDPLSTFSIDVDAASYSQIRRSINMGRLPRTEIVRIEEMINYFKYDYPKPTGETPFSITTEVADCPWNAEHKLVHIGLQGKEMELESRPENNLVFLIDVSGSMWHLDKLPLLKQSLRLLVSQLNEKDHISIVVYAGAAGLVLPSTSGDKKEKILEALDKLKSGGSTAGGAGILLAYSIAEKKFLKKGNNRIILCTDGDFNVGISSEKGLEQLIEEKRESGVFLTVLGFGTANFQDHKMEILANKGNGNFAYIDNLQEAQKVLVQEFWGTLFVIAKDVKIQVEFNPANVLAYRLIGYENRRLAAKDFNDDRKDAGELGAGHTVTALYEIIPVGVELPKKPLIDSLKYQLTTGSLSVGHKDELLTVKLRYKKPDEDVSSLIVEPLTNSSVQLAESSNNMRFSAALSQFGMILLDKELKAAQRMTQIKQVIELAQGSKGADADGRRAEFIRLAELAMIME